MTATNTSVSTASSTAGLGQKTRIAAANATALYLLAYLAADTLYRLATVLMAQRLGIPTRWGLDRVQFLISNPSWWRTAVIGVYGVGPLACLLLGLGAFLWFWQSARFKRGLFKQYLMWLAFHCLNLVCGAMVADTITQSGFWYVPSWLFLAGNIPNVIVAVLLGLIMGAVSYFAAVVFLQSHDSRTLMRYEHRRRLILTTLFLPWILGSLLLYAAKYPHMSVNEQLHCATLLLLLGPLAFGSKNELFQFTIDAPQKTRVAWGLLLLLGLTLTAARAVLGGGVYFG